LALVALWNKSADADPIPAGLHSQTVELRGNGITVLTYRPAPCNGLSLLLAFHGSERSAETARTNTRRFADAHCMLILAPLFDEARFPLWRYNWGGVIHDGMPQDPTSWTGNIALDLVAWARRQEGRTLAYSMIGHSAGAQFLQRLAAYMPQ